jgi:hypothetical protein
MAASLLEVVSKPVSAGWPSLKELRLSTGFLKVSLRTFLGTSRGWCLLHLA